MNYCNKLVRALAGMIQKLGLVFPENIGLIPFAYELYANRHRGKGKRTLFNVELTNVVYQSSKTK
ncbi:hypothetical protein ARMSODRAFT_1022027 [Armillaria solidipes]|uniref:Uncharacterized protein n=1 Tax=Armillaria solidipes TaxID=1076256 RepID=A0A2H3B3T7_9AGAR|nr:hypothetical protein ARMSODRAFT_1022027 [Armillaria solidipes]